MTLFQNNWNNFLSLDQYDLSDNLFDNDLELFSVGTSSEFLFNNSPDELVPRSIHHDCKQLESSGGSLQSSDVSETSEYQLDIQQQSKKCEIRNQDCMWSGTNNSYSRSNSNGSSSSSSSSSSNSSNGGDKHRTRNNSLNFDVDFSIIKQENGKSDLVSPCDVIQLPKIYHQQQLLKQTTAGGGQQQKALSTAAGVAHSMQNIPPGTSLLINSRNQLKKQQQDLRVSIPNLLTTDFLKDRDSLSTSSNGRPDTPLSLDDDALEFKHNVDLSACVMGSNNISLETDEVKKINTIKEDLEENRDIRQYFSSTGRHRSLSEVLNIIGNVETTTTITTTSSIGDSSSSSCSSSSSSSSSSCSLQSPSYSTNSGNRNSSNSISSNNRHIDVEESDETDSDDDDTAGSSSSIPFTSPSATRQQIDFSVAHSDHSYTRSNVDIVGLETPSDSDEEIDVVSIGDKKLPTNPSDKDRRALQTKVAHKISASRMVKTANGLKTIPPRRRGSLMDSYSGNNATIASGTCTPGGVGGRTTITSRYSSPGSTPSYYSSSSSGGVTTKYSAPPTPLSSTSTNGSRKRNHQQQQHSSSLKDEYFPPSKRNRSKKGGNSSGNSSNASSSSSHHHYSSQQHHHHHHSSGVSSSSASLYSRNGNRKYDPNDTDPSTIEKRNLHNDMERQRRIGLKNLFEALKKQIPTLQDKERAPKVNILREAATLCAQMTREDSLLIAQKQQLQIQLQKREIHLKNLLKQQQHLS